MRLVLWNLPKLVRLGTNSSFLVITIAPSWWVCDFNLCLIRHKTRALQKKMKVDHSMIRTEFLREPRRLSLDRWILRNRSSSSFYSSLFQKYLWQLLLMVELTWARRKSDEGLSRIGLPVDIPVGSCLDHTVIDMEQPSLAVSSFIPWLWFLDFLRVLS